MSGLNPGLTTGNMLDAGASSATKNTDLTDGIFEDASSDMKSKQQGSVLASGVQGGMLDAMTGSTGSLGYDAKHQTGVSNLGGLSNNGNMTGMVGSAVEDARNKTQSATDTASQYLKGSANQAAASGNNAASVIGSSARNTADNASQTQGSMLDTVKEKIGGIFQGSGTSQQESTFAAGASGAAKSTDLTDGIHEDAGRGIESVQGVTTRRN